LLLASCGSPPNAVLEVRLDLPTRYDDAGATRGFAHVAVLPSDEMIEPGTTLDASSHVFDLSQRDERGCNVVLSVVADDPGEDRARIERGMGHGLLMLVRFCPTREPCDASEAPVWLFDFDKALWPGERSFFEAALAGSRCSSWGVPVSTLPSQQRGADVSDDFDHSARVRRCDVLGCLDETSRPAADVGFCRDDGVHPCD
jgi:hypothetical protein